MKVIISGAQCVGKTTLINNLPEDYKDYVIKEQIRAAVKQVPNIKHDLESDDFSQRFFFDLYRELFYNKKDYISDRGMLDVLAYTKYFVLTNNCTMGCYEDMLNDFQKLDLSDVTYVYIPIEFSATEDGFRNIDEEYRRGVSRCICEVMSDCGIEPYIISGEMLQRQSQLNELLYSIRYHEQI